MRVAGPGDKVTAASKAGIQDTSEERDPADSELEPEDLGEPARVGRRRTDPNTFVVQFREGVTVEEMERAVRAVGAEPESTVAALRQVVASIDETDRDEAEAELDQNPNVTAVADNALRYASADPLDPGYYDQLHLLTSRLPVAWEVTKGSAALDIAILDTGVDLDHPDLDGRLVAGIDVVNNDSNPNDDEGHGTMVAGIAAAETNNEIGVAGVAWNARIMPVKVLGSDGSGTDGDIAEGIAWAVDHGAEVINLSLGGPGDSAPLENAVAYATSHNVVVVAAAGNEGTSEPSMPAAIPDVVAVGATDLNGELASFSNYGSWVDLAAPGTEIISTMMDTTEAYGIGDGTSFASPIVAGVALMVRAKNTSWTPAQIGAKLASSASDRGPDGIDESYGRGLLDAYGAVGGRTAASPPFPSRGLNEPNDVVDRATVVTSSAQGTIAPEGDVDWYAFDAPEAGSITLTVNPGAPSGVFGFDPVVQAFSPDLDSVGSLDDAGIGGSEELSIATTGAGRYTFRVSSFLGSREPTTYSVNVGFTPGAAGGAGTDRLWVRSVTPEDFAGEVVASVQPTVVFGRDLEAASVNTTTVRLLNGTTGAVVPTTPTYDAGTKTVTLAPGAALGPGPYLLDVRNVADTGAATLTKPYSSRFTVKGPTVNPPTRSDVNGDGYDDIVVGSPNEDIGSKTDAGIVQVIFGTSSGSRPTGAQLLHQDVTGVASSAESGDQFGAAIATGDVNNDGYDDVAVGVPGEDGSVADVGLVHLFLGSPSGLKTSGSQSWEQNSPGILDWSEAGDRFGAALAFGNFDNVAGSDLAIGVPGEKVGKATAAGAIHVLSGRSTGLTASLTKLWTQKSIYGVDVPNASFGAAMAAGDFDGDTHDDLVVGAPNEDLNDLDQGSVTLFRGTIVGLRPGGALWSELLTGTPAARAERFGAAVAVGEFGGLSQSPDGYADLVIGVPGSDARAGRIETFYSDWRGPGATIRTVRQSGSDAPEAGDNFGAALATGRAKGSTVDYLAIGAPGEDVGSVKDAGQAHLASPSSWVASNQVPSSLAFNENTAKIPGSAETGDRFGSAVRVLDVDRDGSPDLVVGTPAESHGGLTAAGTLHVLRRAQNPEVMTVQYLYQGRDGLGGSAEAGDRFGAAIGG
ncbi:MAG: S8 family serine peptidase [Actinomycetota bacterium]